MSTTTGAEAPGIDTAAETGVDRLPERTALPALADPDFDRFAELVRRVLGVPTAMVSLVDRDGQVFPGASGLPAEQQRSRRTPLSHSLCRRVVTDAAPLVLDDAAGDPAVCLHPAVTELGIAAYAGMPLTDRSGTVVGSLCAADTVPRSWTDEQLGDLRDLAAACSAELQLRQATTDAVRDAERVRVLLGSMPVGFLVLDAEWRFDTVNAEAARLSGSTAAEMTGRVLWEMFPASVGSELETVYRRVRDTGRPEVFEFFYPAPLDRWYEIRVQNDDAALLVYFVDITERVESDDRAERILAEMPVGFVALDTDFRIIAANLLGAHLVGSTVEELVGQVAWERFPDLEASEFGPVLRRVAATRRTEVVESYYPPPLDAWYDCRAISDGDRISLFFTDVSARRRAQAVVEQAAEHDRTVARTLQESLLTALPEVRGLSLAARYLTAEGTDQVGGDWYDAVVQPSGALAVSVGDVCGHGIEAAAAMGQLRSMLRALLWDDERTVGDALGRLDRVARGHRDLPLATLVSGRVEDAATPGGARFVWSNAGHPPPLVLLADGTVERCEAEPELMLGILPDTRRTDHARALPAGATLVLYTDGLVERRTASIQAGIDLLTASLRRHAGADLDRLLDLVLADLRHDDQDDDIALLAVRVDADSAADPEAGLKADLEAVGVGRGPGFELALPADDTAPRLARAFVAEAADGASADVVDTLVLLTSEVVTNAVRHARSEAVIGVVRDATGVVVSVHDDGAELPAVAARGALATGGRGLPIIDALAAAWGVDTEADRPGKTVWFRVDEPGEEEHR